MKKVTLILHEETEMAQIKYGKEELCFGNYWDFHAGCYGTEMEINGKQYDFRKEWTDEVKRPREVAEMIARKIGAQVIIKYRKTEFDC